MTEEDMLCRVILTWDDGPTYPVARKIMQLAQQYRVDDIELYWNGATLLRQEIRGQLGIGLHKDVPRVRDGARVPWLKWLDYARGHQKRSEFALGLLDPAILHMCRGIRQYLDPKSLCENIGYHGITHEYSRSPSHPMSLGAEDFEQEFEFFEALIQAAFDAPNFRVRKGRAPYGSGMWFNIENPAQKYQDAYLTMLTRSRQVRPDFEWNAWEVDSLDYDNEGYFDESAVVRSAHEIAARLGKPQVRILMHERYYCAESRTLKRLFEQLTRQVEDPTPREGCLSPDGFRYRLELGPRWSVAKLNWLLQKAQNHLDAGCRLAFIARSFLEENTPFEFEEDLPSVPSEMVRARLESFDCVTFIYTMVALCHAKTTEEFIRNLRRIRYASSGVGEPHLVHYTINAVKRMEVFGFVEDITNVIVPASLLRQRVVPKLGILPTGEPFLRHCYGAAGDLGIGQPAAIAYIPGEALETAEPMLRDGDIALFVTAREVGDYPGLVGHVAIVSREEPHSLALVLHSSKTPLGRPGKRAGVSLSTYWETAKSALRDDCIWRPLVRFLQDNPDRWSGISVLRPTNSASGGGHF